MVDKKSVKELKKLFVRNRLKFKLFFTDNAGEQLKIKPIHNIKLSYDFRWLTNCFCCAFISKYKFTVWKTEAQTFSRTSPFVFHKEKNMIWVWSNLRVCRWFLGEVTILLTYMNYSWCLMVISEGYAVFPLCQRYIHNQNMMFSCYNEQAVMRRCHPHCNVCCVSYMPNFIRLLLVSV